MCVFLSLIAGKDGAKVTTVVATPGQGSDRVQEVSYTDTRVIGNGSFGVVFQAKLIETNELVAIKKVLQDRRFKVSKFDWKKEKKQIRSDFVPNKTRIFLGIS